MIGWHSGKPLVFLKRCAVIFPAPRIKQRGESFAVLKGRTFSEQGNDRSWNPWQIAQGVAWSNKTAFSLFAQAFFIVRREYFPLVYLLIWLCGVYECMRSASRLVKKAKKTLRLNPWKEERTGSNRMSLNPKGKHTLCSFTRSNDSFHFHSQ